jgi:hypothetical protein
MADNRIANIEEMRLIDSGNGDAFVARIARAGPLIGSSGLGCTLTVLPSGKRAYPFHRHHYHATSRRGEAHPEPSE